MNVFAIDPGPEKSAIILYDSAKKNIVVKAIVENDQVLDILSRPPNSLTLLCFAIEMVACYGMPVGEEVFSTVLWIGRFVQKITDAGNEAVLVYRKDIKLHFCQTARAKDSNIRQVLIDRFGDPGIKKAPGFLYGVKSHEWSALAVAIYFTDMKGFQNGES